MPDGTTMPMSSMMMTFFTSTTTPLYSAAWSSATTGQYAGTCIFLIFFATVFRALLALRAVQERKWQRLEMGRRYAIAMPGQSGDIGSGNGSRNDDGDERKTSGESESSSSTSEKDGAVVVAAAVKDRMLRVRPWRVSQDGPRACLDVVVAGVGYLL